MSGSTKRLAETETVERDEDVRRHALAEALRRVAAGLRDDDVEVRRQSQADRGGQAEDYRANRAHLYGLERRWPAAPFWRDRIEACSAAATRR